MDPEHAGEIINLIWPGNGKILEEEPESDARKKRAPGQLSS